MKIRTKLLLSFSFMLLFVSLFLGNRLLDEITPHYFESMEESLNDTAQILASLVETELDSYHGNLSKMDFSFFKKSFERAYIKTFNAKIFALNKTRMDVRIYIVDRNGIVIFDSDNGRDFGRDYSHWNDVYLTLRGKYGARSSQDDPVYKQISIKYVAAPLKYRERIIGVITVAKPSKKIIEFINLARYNVILVIGSTFLLLFLLGLAITMWVTQPVEKLLDYLKALNRSRPVPLPDLGEGDMADLGRAMEKMRDKLEGKKYIESYVQNLTHEMKSPLTSILGASELLREEIPDNEKKKFIENINRESHRLKDMIERLLKLSALEAQKSLKEIEIISLEKVFIEIIEHSQWVLRTKNLKIEKQIPPGIFMEGELFLIHQALDNIFQNAIHFSIPNSTIFIQVSEKDKEISIVIENTGKQIPAYAMKRIFERFYSLERPDTGQKSSGLGLPFVQETARLHGGDIRLENISPQRVRAVLQIPQKQFTTKE